MCDERSLHVNRFLSFMWYTSSFRSTSLGSQKNRRVCYWYKICPRILPLPYPGDPAAAAPAEPALPPIPSTTIPATAVAESHQKSITAATTAGTVSSHGESADDAAPPVEPPNNRTLATACSRRAGVIVAGWSALSSNAPRCAWPTF